MKQKRKEDDRDGQNRKHCKFKDNYIPRISDGLNVGMRRSEFAQRSNDASERRGK